jgi:hypothetical protein
MQNKVHSRQRSHRLRAKQSMRVGDDSGDDHT